MEKESHCLPKNTPHRARQTGTVPQPNITQFAYVIDLGRYWTRSSSIRLQFASWSRSREGGSSCKTKLCDVTLLYQDTVQKKKREPATMYLCRVGVCVWYVRTCGVCIPWRDDSSQWLWNSDSWRIEILVNWRENRGRYDLYAKKISSIIIYYILLFLYFI